jgi:N-methylhydantoinase A
MDVLDGAAAIYRLANSLFHDLLHKTTVQRGLDPREFTLFSFGGTAGMHVASYAEELGTPRIVIPYSASVHGAFGLITSDIAHEDQVTQPMHLPADVGEVAGIYSDLERRMTEQLAEEGFEGDAVHLQRAIDMRYRRQVHILTVPVDSDAPLDEAMLERAIERFEDLYREKYGEESAYREAGIELVSFRLRGEGAVRKPEFRHADAGGADASGAIAKRVQAWVPLAEEMREIDGYDFERLEPGNAFAGPAIVWTPITTVVAGEGQQVQVDEYKNLVITTSVGLAREAEAAVGAGA